MGVLDIFRRNSILVQAKSAGAFAPQGMNSIELPPGQTTVTDEMVRALAHSIKGMGPRRLWETQHSVRMVVDFLSRNIGQLSLQSFKRADDGGRERLRDSPLTRLLSAPNAQMTGYDLIVALVSDLALFDEAWWLVRPTREGGWEIRPLAVDRVSITSGYEIDGNLVVSYSMGTGKEPLTIWQSQLLHFRGWDPGYGRTVSPAVRTLRDVLAEQVASQEFRLKVWENGGQISQYITRPKDAAPWSSEAADRFKEGMAGYSSGGGKEGKMPVLEDGMTINQTRFNAKDEQWAEAAQLALETVARAFHINPAMLGATGGVSYANVREFRKMLYGETLGPWLKMIQDRINRYLIPMIGEESGVYVEFNVKAKLAASFDEQAAVLSSSVGRPWMTADEARALENMPALGGDAAALVTPLNVLVGGQASPRESAPKSADLASVDWLLREATLAGMDGKASTADDLRKAAISMLTPITSQPIKRDPVKLKGEPTRSSEKTVEQVLAQFFKRQRESVLAKINAKADAPWWDKERWDKELADDLYKAAVSVTGQVAADTLDSIGEDPDAYDMGRTQNFLKSVAKSRAGMINATTESQVQDAMDNAEDEDYEGENNSPEHVFDVAEEGRGKGIVQTLLTTFAGFAVTEAVKQVVSPNAGATKTWSVMSSNTRSEHAAMDGETVSMDDTFSNGANWPGDPVLGAEGVSNCMCGVEITVP